MTPTSTATDAPTSSPARTIILATIAGFVLVTATVIGLSLYLGETTGGAIGVGLFVGIWGGAGFGFMVAAAGSASRAADREHAEKEARRARAAAQ